MPDPKTVKYRVQDPSTGKEYFFDGEEGIPPTDQEVEEHLNSLKPKPSIFTRTMANSLFTMRDNARKKYLASRGVNPEEGGWGIRPGKIDLRELAADTIETVVPNALKFGMQAGGEMGGAAIGTSFGGVGAFLGDVLGGAGARGITQAGIETVADLTGMSPDTEQFGTAHNRIKGEAISGAVTSAAGRTLSAALPWARKLPPVRKAEEYLLENVAKMPIAMQRWAEERGYGELYNQYKKPIEQLVEVIRKNIEKPLRDKRDVLGAEATAQELAAHRAPVKADFTGLTNEVTNAMNNKFAHITSGERSAFIKMAKNLEEVGGDKIAQAYASGATKKVINSAGKETEVLLGDVLKEQYEKSIDTLINLERGIEKSVGSGQKISGSMERASELAAAASKVREFIVEKMKVGNEALKQAKLGYENIAKELEALAEHAGKGTQGLLDFLGKELFADKTYGNVLGKEATDTIFSKTLGDKATEELVKDLVTAAFMKQRAVLTAGVKTFLPGVIGSGVGGLAGATAGALSGQPGLMGKWSRQGAMVGGAITLPYMTPSMQSALYRFAAKRGPGATASTRAITRFLATPLAGIINDIQDKYSAPVTKKDIDQLKSAPTK